MLDAQHMTISVCSFILRKEHVHALVTVEGASLDWMIDSFGILYMPLNHSALEARWHLKPFGSMLPT